MQKFTFVCKTHDEYGGLGWALKSKPHFEPLPGMTVAHDVMEHFPRDNATHSGMVDCCRGQSLDDRY